MKLLGMIIGMFLLASSACAQSTEEVQLITSAECGDCKERIEGKLNYVAGIRFAELDVPTKVLTVKFTPKKISLDEIQNILAEIGYASDDVKANPEAVAKLPVCCQPGGMSK